jgi:hypothetical protein
MLDKPRERRTKAEIEVIRAAILQVVGSDPPMTVRQVFYQLLVRGVIEKTEAEYQNVVIRLISEMRLDGSLPWDWIVDESRRMRVTQTFDNIKDAIEHTARTYRRCAMAQSDSSFTFLYGTALAIQRAEEAGKELCNLPTRPTQREGQPTRPRFCRCRIGYATTPRFARYRAGGDRATHLSQRRHCGSRRIPNASCCGHGYISGKQRGKNPP